jgi:aerobic-type carbon monoxide dehydrogenase small subunit (CoxS/CutS family)
MVSKLDRHRNRRYNQALVAQLVPFLRSCAARDESAREAPVRSPVNGKITPSGGFAVTQKASSRKASSKISRRRFVEGTGAGLVAASVVPLQGQQHAAPAQTAAASAVPRTQIKFTMNGVPRTMEVEDRWTLVELLRDHLNLTGTKIGCDRGECGACTVLLDGKSVYSCSHLAAWIDGKSVVTVEGLAQNGKLDPLQQAFIDHDGPQCGFCTSGQLMSAKALVMRSPHPTREEVRAGMTGNLCRCSNYNHYVEAVLAATAKAATTGGGGNA